MIAATISNKLVRIDVLQPVGALCDGQTKFVDVIGKVLKWDSCHKASPGYANHKPAEEVVWKPAP